MRAFLFCVVIMISFFVDVSSKKKYNFNQKVLKALECDNRLDGAFRYVSQVALAVPDSGSSKSDQFWSEFCKKEFQVYQGTCQNGIFIEHIEGCVCKLGYYGDKCHNRTTRAGSSSFEMIIIVAVVILIVLIGAYGYWKFQSAI